MQHSNPVDADDGVRTYWAFLSYSRADSAEAAKLHRRLERYRIPRPLVGEYSVDGGIPKRIAPVFRDLDELSASSSLNNTIGEALRHSRYFVVLCTPASVRSKWVNGEVLEYIRLGRRERIRCFIPAGVPGHIASEDLIPAVLTEHVSNDGTAGADVPLAVDARPGRDGRDAFLKLAAGLLGTGLDRLKRRDRARAFHRAVVATAMAAVIGTAALAVVRSFRHETAAANTAADEAKRMERLTASASAVDRAMALAREGDAESALAWLAKAARTDPSNPAATAALMTLLMDRHWPMRQFGGGIASVKVSDNGALLVSVSDNGLVQLWELPSGKPVRTEGLDAPVEGVAVNAAGSRLAVNRGAEVLFIDVPSGNVAPTHTDGARTCDMVFSGDDLWRASSSGGLDRFRAGAWTRVAALEVSTDLCPTQWDISRDGRTIAVSSADGFWLVDTAPETPVVTRVDVPRHATTVRFAQDGATVAIGNIGSVHRRDVKTGREVGTQLRTGMEDKQPLAFHAQGTEIAMHDRSGQGVILAGWPAEGDDPQILITTGKRIRSFAFDAMRRRVLAVGDDDRVSVWTLNSVAPVRFELPRVEGVSGAWFTSDPLVLATLSAGKITLWALRARGAGMMHLPHENAGEIATATFVERDDRVISQNETQINIWSRRTGERLAELSSTLPVAVGATAQHMAVWGRSEEPDRDFLEIHTLSTQSPPASVPVKGRILAAAVSADSTLVAIGLSDGVYLAHTADSRALRKLAAPGKSIRQIEWRRDGRVLLVRTEGHAALIRADDGTRVGQIPCDVESPLGWDAVSGSLACAAGLNVRWLRAGPDTTPRSGERIARHVLELRFSSTGRWLAINSKTQTWIAGVEQEGRVVVPTASGAPRTLDFSEATSTVAIKTGRTEISLWNLNTGAPAGMRMNHRDEVKSAAFRGTGDILASGAGSSLYLWDTAVRVGQMIGSPAALPMAVHAVVFAPDGKTVAASCGLGYGSKHFPGFVVLMPLLTSVSTDAEKLARLAEAVAGETVNDEGGVAPLRGADDKRSVLARDTDPFIAWFFGDPWTRAIVPGSTTSVTEYLESKLRAGQFLEAETEFPGHPLFARYRRTVMVRGLTPLEQMADHGPVLKILQAENVFGADTPPGEIRIAGVALRGSEPPSMVAIHASAGYCGSGGCSYRLAVLEPDGSSWRVAGRGECGESIQVVVTTTFRGGRADFFCDTIRHRWNGSAYELATLGLLVSSGPR